jgi:hypothetical protein
MMASRGMGAINPSKMPGGKKKTRRDDTDFTQYKEGGLTSFGKAGAKATRNLADKEYAEAHYKKEAAKVKEIELGPKTPVGKKKGGKVNAAGNYTKPELRKKIVSQVKSAATHGTGAGQWSARKSQLVAKKYKAAGGGYRD